MRLALPVSIVDHEGVIGAGRPERRTGLELLPDARLGECALVQAGSAMALREEAEATETLARLAQTVACSARTARRV